MDSVFSSIFIILAILFVTFILSLLLRFLHLRLNRRRLLSNSTPPRSPQPLPPLTTIITEPPPASVTIDSLPPIPFHFTSDSTPTPSQPPPTAPEIQRSIDSLPTFHFSSISNATITADCAVCLTTFTNTDLLRALPRCCHAFHSECIDNWLRSSNLSCCPLCRSTIFASESDLAAILRSPSDSFRVEIGNVSRREIIPEAVAGDALSSYSIGGSFDYRVTEVSQVPVSAVSSFRGSGRFFSGSSRRIGEEITEMFRWLSGDY